MGSSKSKRRKGADHQHLPKVGSAANDHWAQQTRRDQVFGSGFRMVLTAAVIVIALVGLLILTL